MDEQELEFLYTKQLNEQILIQTRQKINQFIEQHPFDFGYELLFNNNNSGQHPNLNPNTTMPEDLAKLYQEICVYYNDNHIEFDHIWVKERVLLSFFYNLLNHFSYRVGRSFGDNNLPIRI